MFFLLKDELKVQSGTTNFLKEDVISLVVFNFENATWEEDENYKAWCGEDYELRNKLAIENFIKAFNDESKSLKLTQETSDAKYRIVFNLTNLERHQSFSGMWGQCKISVTGVMEIIEIQTNKTVCSIFINKFGSGKDFTVTDGITKCFFGLGEKLTEID